MKYRSEIVIEVVEERPGRLVGVRAPVPANAQASCWCKPGICLDPERCPHGRTFAVEVPVVGRRRAA